MNPPFSAALRVHRQGRAVAHPTAGAGLLVPGGRVASILPASRRGRIILDGFNHEYSEVVSNVFAGKSAFACASCGNEAGDAAPCP